MKKLWIYLAMPVALLNGCGNRQAALKEANTLTVENGTGTEDSRGEISEESRKDRGLKAENGKSAETNCDTGKKMITEAPFYGSTVSIIRSEKEKASMITEEEIEAMVRKAA